MVEWRFGVSGYFAESWELWSAFNILDVVGGCLGTHLRVKKNFVSQGTLDTIDQSQGQA